MAGAAGVKRAMDDAVWRCQRALLYHGRNGRCDCDSCERVLWAQVVFRDWTDEVITASDLRTAMRFLETAETAVIEPTGDEEGD